MSHYTLAGQTAGGGELISRAFVAYFRSAAHEGILSPDIPASDSYLCEVGGKQYVVLHNIKGVLAVYRVRNDGVLKGLKRWPKQIEQWEHPAE